MFVLWNIVNCFVGAETKAVMLVLVAATGGNTAKVVVGGKENQLRSIF